MGAKTDWDSREEWEDQEAGSYQRLKQALGEGFPLVTNQLKQKLDDSNNQNLDLLNQIQGAHQHILEL